jgi:NADH:ubiquinone oxidoreductase subunit K
MFELSLGHFLVLGALLFGLGMFGAITRRSAIAILMCIELMFNGVNVTLVALNYYLWPANLTGQLFVIFTISVAAVEASVGLALVIAVYRQFKTSFADQISLLSDGFHNSMSSFGKIGAPETEPLVGQASGTHAAPGQGH